MSMNFTETNDRSPKRLVGLGAVILLHVLVAYILMSGLGKDIVKVIQQPVELQIIQDIKPPPPPKPEPKPETKPIEPPKMVEKVAKAPDPKPVDTPKVSEPQPTPTPVRESVPQPTAPSAPSPSPVAAAPAAPPAPPAPPKPAGVSRGVSEGEAGCAQPDYPRESLMNEEEGTVRVSVLVDPNGKVIDTKVKKSSGSKTLDKAASKAWSKCTFKPAMKDGAAQQDWYDLEYSFVLQ